MEAAWHEEYWTISAGFPNMKSNVLLRNHIHVPSNHSVLGRFISENYHDKKQSKKRIWHLKTNHLMQNEESKIKFANYEH